MFLFCFQHRNSWSAFCGSPRPYSRQLRKRRKRKAPGMPLQIHAGEVLLPQRLIHRDCRRVGKIQRADVPQHGNAHAGVRMLPQEPFGKSRSLLAEHQHTLRRIPHLGIAARRFGREKKSCRSAFFSRNSVRFS